LEISVSLIFAGPVGVQAPPNAIAAIANTARANRPRLDSAFKGETPEYCPRLYIPAVSGGKK
jgi:hypothetical protein